MEQTPREILLGIFLLCRFFDVARFRSVSVKWKEHCDWLLHQTKKTFPLVLDHQWAGTEIPVLKQRKPISPKAWCSIIRTSIIFNLPELHARFEDFGYLEVKPSNALDFLTGLCDYGLLDHPLAKLSRSAALDQISQELHCVFRDPRFVLLPEECQKDALSRWGTLPPARSPAWLSILEKLQVPEKGNRDLLTTAVVCFFADGSERYTRMTIIAMKTFMIKNNAVVIGLLVHDDETTNRIFAAIETRLHYRIIVKKTRPPSFPNWNPTQYKLDIEQFTDEFDYIFWCDSDTLTTSPCFSTHSGDFSAFYHSKNDFMLIPDHVMFDPQFMDLWHQQRNSPKEVNWLIPQACLMGFKSTIITKFFALWRKIWNEWIDPVPFSGYPDPRPDFPGSAFCIEQYALGMALNQFGVDLKNSVLKISRNLISFPIETPSEEITTVPTTPSEIMAQKVENESQGVFRPGTQIPLLASNRAAVYRLTDRHNPWMQSGYFRTTSCSPGYWKWVGYQGSHNTSMSFVRDPEHFRELYGREKAIIVDYFCDGIVHCYNQFFDAVLECLPGVDDKLQDFDYFSTYGERFTTSSYHYPYYYRKPR